MVGVGRRVRRRARAEWIAEYDQGNFATAHALYQWRGVPLANLEKQLVNDRLEHNRAVSEHRRIKWICEYRARRGPGAANQLLEVAIRHGAGMHKVRLVYGDGTQDGDGHGQINAQGKAAEGAAETSAALPQRLHDPHRGKRG